MCTWKISLRKHGISFTLSLLSREHMRPTNLPDHIWVASQRTWLDRCTGIAQVIGSNPVDAPEILQVHIWDNRWGCPAIVRIISSIQKAWCPLCTTSRRPGNQTCCYISSELWKGGQLWGSFLQFRRLDVPYVQHLVDQAIKLAVTFPQNFEKVVNCEDHFFNSEGLMSLMYNIS